jgi:hypothetical protein
VARIASSGSSTVTLRRLLSGFPTPCPGSRAVTRLSPRKRHVHRFRRARRQYADAHDHPSDCVGAQRAAVGVAAGFLIGHAAPEARPLTPSGTWSSNVSRRSSDSTSFVPRAGAEHPSPRQAGRGATTHPRVRLSVLFSCAEFGCPPLRGPRGGERGNEPLDVAVNAASGSSRRRLPRDPLKTAAGGLVRQASGSLPAGALSPRSSRPGWPRSGGQGCPPHV